MPRPPRLPCRVALGALLVAMSVAIDLPSARAAGDTGYEPPVDAPIVDPFRPPEHPYGPGNRGLEYDTPPGTPVRAAAAGTVSFAGLVAGSRHVTVLHDDGLRTTASYLDEVAVVVGQRVEQGDVLGTTAGRLHFSARHGDGYLDPASLFTTGPPRVHLVPFDVPPGVGIGGERSAIHQLLGLGGDLLDVAAEAVEAGADAGREVARLAVEYGPYAVPLLRTALLVRTTIQLVQRARAMASRPCTDEGAHIAPPAERRVAVLVAGLGSTSERASIDDVDVGALGYEPDDVRRFSYAGGREPYGKAETQLDLHHSAALLADLLEDVASSADGAPVDVYAHSQGGVVARLAVIELERRHGSAWVDRLGLLATIATPHGGADLATAIRAIGLSPFGDVALDLVEPVVGLDDDAPNAAQLSETSDVVQELAEHPVPASLDAVSIAARGDLVVPVPRARFEGAREVVVPLVGPTAHGDLPGDPRTTRELALALTGAAPACVSFVQALADQAFGEATSWTEDRLGSALAATALLAPFG
jgi:hypothetical protein